MHRHVTLPACSIDHACLCMLLPVSSKGIHMVSEHIRTAPRDPLSCPCNHIDYKSRLCPAVLHQRHQSHQDCPHLQVCFCQDQPGTLLTGVHCIVLPSLPTTLLTGVHCIVLPSLPVTLLTGAHLIALSSLQPHRQTHGIRTQACKSH